MSTNLNKQCLQSLSQLLAQLQTTLEENTRQDANWLQQRQSLSLANALLRNNNTEITNAPRHIVVVGPTQVGKSTVINHLLGSEQAGVSALAGYTRHAQGFTSGNVEASIYAQIFPTWKLVTQNQLDPDNTKQFSINTIKSDPNKAQQDIVYWDTPDFDSVSSRSYRTIVPNLSAMASVLVLVISKEKYADNSVWEFLKMLAPLQLPLVICLNKSEANHQDVITTEIRDRLAAMNCQHQAIVTLPWQKTDTTDPSEQISTLRKTVTNALSAQPKKPRLDSYFNNNWETWIQPVLAEHQARADWDVKIDEVSKQLLLYYQENYLQQTRYSEALQRAISKLLELLEIPILAGTLGTLRKVITWPVRTLGKTILDSVSDVRDKSQTNESIILNEAYQNALVDLVNKTQQSNTDNNPQQQLWWANINDKLRLERDSLQTQAEQTIAQLQDSFEPEIDAAANRLYQKLEDQPATLNSLRAARVTTDAAALALAFHTGGLSTTDLILAPALLSVTSLVAESAVGQHMKVIEKELKEKQYQQVETNLVESRLRQPLHNLSQQLTAASLYNITEADLKTAQQCLSEL